MARSIYEMPITTTTVKGQPFRTAKYVDTFDGGALTGTGSATAGQATLTGSGTSFTTQLVEGSRMAVVGGGGDLGWEATVTAITSNTQLTVTNVQDLQTTVYSAMFPVTFSGRGLTVSNSWSMWDYGDEPHCLVGVTNISSSLDTALTANGDVFKLPDNLDTQVASTNTRNQLRTRLEQDEFPGTWVETTTTYRELTRVVGSCCRFAQHYQELGLGPWFTGTIHVQNTFSTLSAAQQQGIRDTATKLGFDQTIIQAANTIRDILKSMADQYIAKYVAGVPGFALDLEGPI